MADRFGQQSHQECPMGYVFLAYMTRREFNQLPFASKEEGQMVYTENGGIYHQGGQLHEARLFPAFAEESEVAAHGCYMISEIDAKIV